MGSFNRLGTNVKCTGEWEIRQTAILGGGTLVWHLVSIGPATGQPTTDPQAGFLPPNLIPPEGDCNK